MVFSYEGLQPTSEASDKKLTSWTGEEKDTPSRSWATRVHQRRKLSTEREPGDLKLVVQEIPLILEARLEQSHSEHPVRDEKLRDDKWPRIRCQRDAGGDVVDRKSSSSRRRLLTRLEEVEP